MVTVCCWTGCWLRAVGLGIVTFGRVALEVFDSRVWRRARVWAAVRMGGVVLGFVGGTVMMRGCR